MDADGARFLRQHGDGRFHFALHRHHEVGHFVDDDNDVWQHTTRVHQVFEGDVRTARFTQRLARPALVFLNFCIEFLEIATGVCLQQSIPVLHFHHRPLEHVRRIAIVRDDLVTQVRQRVVHAELDHFRIDHQESQRFGRVPVHQTGDDGVHAHRLA